MICFRSPLEHLWLRFTCWRLGHTYAENRWVEDEDFPLCYPLCDRCGARGAREDRLWPLDPYDPRSENYVGHLRAIEDGMARCICTGTVDDRCALHGR